MEKKIRAFLYQYVVVIFVLGLTVFAMLPLFQPGFYPMHDDEQVGRLYALDLAIKSGHIPPRISPELGFGYSYPLFNFYPSFVYYVGEIFVLLGFSYILSIKLMIAAGFLLAAFFMYLFVKEYFGKMSGIVAAVAYTYTPYHALDVYVRGALPEFWAFVFIPALFWGLKNIADAGKIQYVVLASIISACLVLTHNLVALMSGVFLFGYFLFLLLSAKDRIRFTRDVFFSGLIGLLLSAFFWLPSYVERNATMIELLTQELADYRQHFVYLRQLWNSPWGYGGSLYGLYDGLSFQIGKIHIVLSIVATGIALYFYGKKKVLAKSVLLFFGLFVISVYFMTFYSRPLWDAIPQLSYIQFPWRFLLFTSFTSSFLIGGLFLYPFSDKQRAWIGGLCVVLLIAGNVGYFQPEKSLTHVTDTDYTRPEVIRWRTSIMAFEYVPRGIATKTSDVGTTIIDIRPDEVASSASTVIRGTMQVTTLVDKPQEKRFSIDVTEPGLLRINTFSFPGWKVYQDEKEISYTAANKFKLITISLPEGRHTVRAVFTDTFPRVLGNTLSAVGLIIIITLLFFSFRQISKKHS
jgi:hypothetical protein